MRVRYSYLSQQFSECDDLWVKLKDFVKTGDFTLGKPLENFESNFADLIGSKYAVGVNSGTDAIKLALKAHGVGIGDEVITTANTFVATVGAICELGAKPVFVDCNDVFCMDTSKVIAAITPETKAIVPVHFSGYMTDMPSLMRIAKEKNLIVIEDSCQSILGAIDGKNAGTWGNCGAFSLHPLKNLNVWSDGGLVVSDDEIIFDSLKLLRNHGLISRDYVEMMGYNSRLDTFQAIVGDWLLPQTNWITDQRIANAKYFDELLQKIPEIKIPPRPINYKVVFHLYMVFAKNRDKLLDYCKAKGIQAKIHYPVPIYRQRALEFLSHKRGDFPVADYQAANLISFPCDQHLTKVEIEYMVQVIQEFYCHG